MHQHTTAVFVIYLPPLTTVCMQDIKNPVRHEKLEIDLRPIGHIHKLEESIIERLLVENMKVLLTHTHTHARSLSLSSINARSVSDSPISPHPLQPIAVVIFSVLRVTSPRCGAHVSVVTRHDCMHTLRVPTAQLLTLNGRYYEKLETVDISGQKLRYYEVTVAVATASQSVRCTRGVPACRWYIWATACATICAVFASTCPFATSAIALGSGSHPPLAPSRQRALPAPIKQRAMYSSVSLC